LHPSLFHVLNVWAASQDFLKVMLACNHCSPKAPSKRRLFLVLYGVRYVSPAIKGGIL
jgi:hypothetical protein